MSLQLQVAWDRPFSTGDGEHWLAVTLSGVAAIKEPTSVAVLVDTSTSMLGSRLTKAKATVVAMVRRGTAADTFGVFTFGSTASAVVVTAGSGDVAGALDGVRANGKTRLDLGMALASEWLTARVGPRHLVLLTDGDPTDAEGRRVPVEPLMDHARQLGSAGIRTTVIAIGIVEGYDTAFLRGLADAGGGVAALGVDAERMVEDTLRALHTGSEGLSDVVISLNASALEVREAWRIVPHAQPIPIQDHAISLAVGDGGTVLFGVRYRAPLGLRRGVMELGEVRVSSRTGDVTAPLSLHLVGPGSPERHSLNPAVDALRVRVELARTAELRARAEDPEDQLRCTRRLGELAGQLGDPRATRRFAADLATLAAGRELTREDQERAIDAARGVENDA